MRGEAATFNVGMDAYVALKQYTEPDIMAKTERTLLALSSIQ